MPERKTIEAARKDKEEGKAPSTQAGEFVREEMEHIRAGKHGARSAKQAIAIGLSKARRAGVDLPPPREGSASERTRRSAERDEEAGKHGTRKVSAKRSRATSTALKREGGAAASKNALSRHAKSAARRRTSADRSTAAKKAAQTRARNTTGRKAAQTQSRKTTGRKTTRTRSRKTGTGSTAQTRSRTKSSA